MTTEPKHTPGPWKAERWEPRKIAGLPAGGIAVHADWKNANGFALLIATIQPEWSNSAHEANAALIASAPDLLAENQRLREMHRVTLDLAKSLTAWCRKAGGDCITADGIIREQQNLRDSLRL